VGGSETTVNVALVPLKATSVALVNPLPVIVRPLPTGPPAGVTLLMVGCAATVKRVALATVPLAVVNAIGPLCAPAGTTAETCVLERLENVVAGTPPTLTAVTPARPLPSTITVVPTGPPEGVMPVMSPRRWSRGGVGWIGCAGGSVARARRKTVRSPLNLPN